MAQPNAFFSRPKTPDNYESGIFQCAKKPELKGHYGRRIGPAEVHTNAGELKLFPSDAKALSSKPYPSFSHIMQADPAISQTPRLTANSLQQSYLTSI